MSIFKNQRLVDLMNTKEADLECPVKGEWRFEFREGSEWGFHLEWLAKKNIQAENTKGWRTLQNNACDRFVAQFTNSFGDCSKYTFEQMQDFWRLYCIGADVMINKQGVGKFFK